MLHKNFYPKLTTNTLTVTPDSVVCLFNNPTTIVYVLLRMNVIEDMFCSKKIYQNNWSVLIRSSVELLLKIRNITNHLTITEAIIKKGK